MEECLSFAKEITKNSFSAVKTSKMLINKGMDVDIDAGFSLEIMVGHFALHMRIDRK
jgi:3-hydroxypropionyl-coenzyme A dehydratase